MNILRWSFFFLKIPTEGWIQYHVAYGLSKILPRACQSPTCSPLANTLSDDLRFGVDNLASDSYLRSPPKGEPMFLFSMLLSASLWAASSNPSVHCSASLPYTMDVITRPRPGSSVYEMIYRDAGSRRSYLCRHTEGFSSLCHYNLFTCGLPNSKEQASLFVCQEHRNPSVLWAELELEQPLKLGNDYRLNCQRGNLK